MMPMQRRLLPLGMLVCTGLACDLAAQSPTSGDSAAPPSAAAPLTAATLTPYLDVLGADSLRSRSTPSPALDRTAQYVADQFRRVGLDSARIWRYPVPGQFVLNAAKTLLFFTVDMRGTTGGAILSEEGDPLTRYTTVKFDSSAYFAPAVGAPVLAIPASPSSSRVGSRVGRSWEGSTSSILLTGRQDPTKFVPATVRDAVVFYCPFADTDTATQGQLLRQLYTASAGVVVVSDAAPPAFAAALQQAQPHNRVPVVDQYMRQAEGEQRWPWAVVVQAAKLRSLFWASGVDLAQQCADPTPTARALPTTDARILPAADTLGPRAHAPVVVGILEGTDSVLKQEYVVIAAPMDVDTTASAGSADRRSARADDAGLAGLLALAEAFSRPGARPRRSLLFLATSGSAGDKKAWGSHAFTTFENAGAHLDHIVGVLALDLRGRPVGDSIRIDGLADVDLARPPAWVAALHPELQLVVADGGGTTARPSGDHFPFALQGIPGLLIYTGAGGGTAASPTATARLLQYTFYLSDLMAAETRRPRLTAEGRRRLSSFRGQ